MLGRVLMLGVFCLVFFFKQKTAYEMRISDWSSDVCSSDLRHAGQFDERAARDLAAHHRFWEDADPAARERDVDHHPGIVAQVQGARRDARGVDRVAHPADRKSTRLNSSH